MSRSAPLVTNHLIIARILASFGRKLGLSPDFADALANVHLLQKPVHLHWSKFLREQCARCIHDPAKCSFFNPVEWRQGSSAEERLAEELMAFESGRFKTCPYMEVKKEENPA